MKRKAATKGKTAELHKQGTISVLSRTTGATISAAGHESSFREVVILIEHARERAFRAVNTELLGLYWQVGEYISRKLESAMWGKAS